ncbi:hypothetical protein [Marinobacter nauticus]|uniref:hypothetical protein n=1 Tax=Marinobacter nauticus TaxID=2743 RepID=UPI0013013B83|nr:hypothetical protein [Marinobacter nauticus]
MDAITGFILGLFFWGFFEGSFLIFWALIYELGKYRSEGKNVLSVFLDRLDIVVGLVFFPMLSVFVLGVVLERSDNFLLSAVGLVVAALVYRPFSRSR